MHAPCARFRSPYTSPEWPLGTALQSGTRGAPMHSVAPRDSHTRTCAPTRRAELETSGLRQGGFFAVVAQQRGEEARPLLGRDPVREIAGGGGQGPALPPHPRSRATVSQAI